MYTKTFQDFCDPKGSFCIELKVLKQLINLNVVHDPVRSQLATNTRTIAAHDSSTS